MGGREGKRIEDLETPFLALDIDDFESNIRRMSEHAAKTGLGLRPHAKTHKCSVIAARQMAAGAVGICAAKLSEAEVLAACGIDKILITSPVVGPLKAEKLAFLAKRHGGMMVALDNLDNAREISEAARKAGAELDVLTDIDPCFGRTGVSYAEAVEFSRKLASLPCLRLRGIQCYAGNLQHIKSFEERRSLSLERLGAAAQVRGRMQALGLECGIFTGGGTGTYNIDCEVDGMTDLQVGSYVFMDAEYMNIGGKTDEARYTDFRPALRIVSRVVSANQKGHVTIDAGLKAIYFTPHAPPEPLTPEFKGMRYEWYGDEHGKLLTDGAKPSLDALVELSVSHCDPTVNLHDALVVVKKGVVVDEWRVDMRGCCR